MKLVIATLACVLMAGCQRDLGPVASATIEQRFEKHMKVASQFCEIPDWRQVFLMKVADDHIELSWRKKPPAGQLHARSVEMQCLLRTFGNSVVTSETTFKIPATALRNEIHPRRVD
jgi:hypothetical protein